MAEVYANSSQSKYTYKLIEPENQIFVFEIVLKKNNQKNKTIRKIKKTKKGNLISQNDCISFNDVKQLSITIVDINSPTDELIINVNLDQINKYSTFINHKIYLEFFSKSDNLECNYNFIN